MYHQLSVGLGIELYSLTLVVQTQTAAFQLNPHAHGRLQKLP